MKNVFKLSLFILVVVLMCTACQGDVTRALRHEGFNIGQDFECEVFFREEGAETIKYLTANDIITPNGTIYEISMAQAYSNKSNCRIADTSLKVVSMFDDRVFKAADGKYYSLVAENNSPAYTQVTANDRSYEIYDLLLKPAENIKAMTADSNNGIYYVLKNDGNVYGVTISQADRNAPPAIVGSVIVYNSADYGGRIIDFGYYGDSGSTFVRTDAKVFRMKAQNVEECSKYADIACHYEMMEAPTFEENMEYILAYNGSTIITTYKKVFTVNN